MERKEFAKQAANIVQRAYDFTIKGRKQGIVELGDDIDADALKRLDVFEFGMRLAVDGADFEYIDNTLSGMINMEQDDAARRLKIIQKEAVMCIQKGFNSWVMLNIIFSIFKDKEHQDVRMFLKNSVIVDYFSKYYEG